MGLGDLIKGGISGILDGVTKGASDIIKDFKADPNKVLDHEEKLLQLKADAENKILDLTEKNYESMLADTADARNLDIKKQESANASWLSKNVAYMIDIFVLLIWGALTIFLLAKALKIVTIEHGVDLTGVYGIYTGVTAVAMTIINFHRGSSKSSEDKSKQISDMLNK